MTTRQIAPFALTRAGFIQEWLGMADALAAQWGDSGAVAKRKSLASALRSKGFEWGKFARCGTRPEVGRVSLDLRESEKRETVYISGSRAGELRIITPSVEVAKRCVDLRLGNMAPLLDALPQKLRVTD